jgi:hypothetical protein
MLSGRCCLFCERCDVAENDDDDDFSFTCFSLGEERGFDVQPKHVCKDYVASSILGCFLEDAGIVDSKKKEQTDN